MRTISPTSVLRGAAVLISVLGGLSAANAQSLTPGARLPLEPPGQAVPKPVLLSPTQMKAMHPTHTQPLSLPPVPIAKHPIDASIPLADPSVLAGPRAALPGHVPSLAAHASKLEAVEPNKQMTITFALKPSHHKEMDDLARRLYDPKDPQFHHFLKPAERIERFSPSVEDFDKVVAFAQQSGLKVTDSTVDRQMVMATGTAAQIQNALGVHLDNYKAEDGTDFYAPDSDPKVPAGIAPLLSCIQQLDNIKPKSNAIPASSLPSKSGAGGTGSGIQPDDIGIWSAPGMPAGEVKYCYQLAYSTNGTPLTGGGQHVALVEFGGFYQSDINYYVWYNANIASPSANLNYTPIQIYGSDVGTTYATGECELDIEMLEAVADGLSQIDVYEDGASVEIDLENILNDDVANQISISYIINETSAATLYDDVTEQLALQGQAVFVSSGDNGAYNGGSNLTVNYLAASPWVTGVGGTTLWVNESNDYGAFYYENSWNDGGYATGGGISQYITIPDYQYNYLVNNSASWNSPTSFYNRNVPDVALDSDPATGYYTHIQGYDQKYGGTSAAAPIWAAFWAQLNQFRALYGIQIMGFGNPALYQIAEGGNYNSDFHDVYGGSSNNYYYPEYGYDCTTGLGSIDGYYMIGDLVNYGSWSPSENFTVNPSTAISGQQLQLGVTFDAPVPLTGSATVTYAVLNGNYLYGVGSQTIYGGATSSSISIQAPDVQSATQESYICYLTYYDQYGRRQGGNHWSNYASTTVYPNAISNFTLSANAYDGQSVTGTITLQEPAAQNEAIDVSTSDPANVSVPSIVTVPQGAQSVNFTVSTKLVAASEQVYVYVKPDSSSGLGIGPASAQFTVAPLLSSVKVSPSSITGSLNATGTITLLSPAPSGGAVVALKSSNSAATVVASVTVPAGATSTNFSIGTTAVSAAVTSKITATHGAAVKTANLRVVPIGVGSVTLTPSTVVGGNSVSGTVTLAAPAAPGSITVSLASNTPSVANPTVTTITIPAGSRTGTFTVKTNAVSATTLVTIKATANGVAKSKTLKVNP